MQIDHLEIEKKAMEVRHTYGIQTYGIKDIFKLITQREIHLIRYPFGKDVLLGFSTVFEGKSVIVCNTSEILAREIFTAAHELGHIIYDFEDSKNNVIIDQDINDINHDIAEARAFYFANCLLMPEAELNKFIKYELKKSGCELVALDIVRMQVEFNVSYAAIVKRLHDIGEISVAQKSKLFDERNMKTSHVLFSVINADEDLLEPANSIKVPDQYMEYVTSNYDNDYIPFSSLESAFQLLGQDATSFIKAASQEEEIDLDDLFEEFEE